MGMKKRQRGSKKDVMKKDDTDTKDRKMEMMAINKMVGRREGSRRNYR